MTAALTGSPASSPPLDRTAVLDRAIGRVRELQAKVAFTLAEQLRADGRFDDARDVLATVERREGISITLLEQKARLAFAAGDRDGARQLLTERVQLRSSVPALTALARFLLETGELDEARRISDELLNSSGGQILAQSLAGNIARASGDLKGARAFYLAIVDQNSEHPASLVTLADLSLQDNDEEAARAFYRRAVNAIETAERRPTWALADAARVAQRLGDANRAEAYAAESEAAANERAHQALASLDGAPSESVKQPLRTTSRSASQRESTADRRSRREADEPLETFPTTIESTEADDPRVLQTLRSLFGHESLRPGQADVINRVMAGRDTLAVMPTGAG